MPSDYDYDNDGTTPFGLTTSLIKVSLIEYILGRHKAEYSLYSGTQSTLPVFE
jgi:hypothetical protein